MTYIQKVMVFFFVTFKIGLLYAGEGDILSSLRLDLSNNTYYFGNIIPRYYRDPATSRMDVVLYAKTCSELHSFAQIIRTIPWKLTPFESERIQGEALECSCFQKGLCLLKVTDLFPAPINNMFRKNLTCHGPSCYTATLMASGFLRPHRLRLITADELEFDLKDGCIEVPFDQREPHDIIAIHPKGRKLVMHTGVYLDSNLLFAKKGPNNKNQFSLEDWTSMFNDKTFDFNVYRCDPSKIQKNSNSNISKLSALADKFGFLVDSNMERPNLIDQLSILDQELKSIKLNNDPIEKFLAESLDTSLYINSKLQLNVSTNDHSKIMLPVDFIKMLKDQGGEAVVTEANHSRLQKGVQVQIHMKKLSKNVLDANLFDEGKWYEVFFVD